MTKNMKSTLTFIFIGCFILTNSAQTTIYTESFETDQFNINYVMNRFTDGGQDYFGVVDANGNTQFVGVNSLNPFAFPMTNLNGIKCVGAEDLKRTDNPLNVSTDDFRGYFITKTLDVSAYGQVEVRLLIGSRDPGAFGTHETDDNDAFRVQYAFDTNIANGANNLSPGLTNESTVNTGIYTDVGRFLPNVPGGSGAMQEDTNLDGTPDGAILNNTLTEYVFIIPVTGTNLSVRIHMDYDDSAEEMAFDNLRLIASGTPPISCTNPTVPTVTNETTSGSDLGLTENGTAINWDWYIVPNGDTAPTIASTPTINDTTSNPVTWSGGNPNTIYDAYVRADCNTDNTDVSAWIGSTTFTTLSQVICPANNALFETTYTTIGWTDGLPNINKCAVIDSDYTTTSFSSYNTTVNVTKTLTIVANTFMEVQDAIINNGIITIEPTGSIVQIDNNATVTGFGTFNTNVNTTSLQDDNRFTYFGSPTINANLGVFSSWAKMDYLWNFDNSIQNWNYIPSASASATTMNAGAGFAIQAAASHTFPFTASTNFNGAFNNGVFTQVLNFDVYNNVVANFIDLEAIDDDSNLVANPYPSAIDAAALLTLNPQANAFYFWTHGSALPGSGNFTTDDYAIWNASGGTAAPSGATAPTHIATGQGFFVEANALGNFTFNNSVRTTGNNNQFRTPTIVNDKIWLNLSSQNGEFTNQILIAFLENATLGNDLQYDATRLGNNYMLSYYSLGLEEEHYAIQARPLLASSDSIPIGFYVNETSISNLSISIDHLELLEEVHIYIKDNLLNITHDLRQEAYNFSVSSPIELNSRFEILFSRNALIINELTLNNKLIVSNKDENHIFVSTQNGRKLVEIAIFDVLGKQLTQIKVTSENTILPININQGTVLFIKVTLANGIVLHKKFLKM